MIRDLPRPSANKTEYERIKNRGFQRFPERRENYNKYLRMRESGYSELVDSMPVKMDYEVSSICNFRCRMCILYNEDKTSPRKQMQYEDFERSILEQYGLIEIKLQGLGEPLLNKDFFRMAKFAVDRDIWVRTVTNGSVLHVDENYKKMIDIGIGEIQVSIDGATKKTFEHIRTGSDFNRVVENVRKMNLYAREKGENWRTSCWMLVQKDNFQEVESLLDLAEYMAFSRVTYSLIVSDFGGYGDWTKVNGEKNVGEEFTEELGNRLIEKGKQKGIDVTFWEGGSKYTWGESRDNICDWLFSRAFISGDMRIVPCCEISDAGIWDVGDALNFSNEWNNEEFIAIRKAHLNGNIPKLCKACYQV